MFGHYFHNIDCNAKLSKKTLQIQEQIDIS